MKIRTNTIVIFDSKTSKKEQLSYMFSPHEIPDYLSLNAKSNFIKVVLRGSPPLCSLAGSTKKSERCII